MKRKLVEGEKDDGDYYSRLPRLPPEITTNVIHIEHLFQVTKVRDLCNWHATQKVFYKQWSNRDYLDKLLQQSKKRNIEEFKKDNHASYIVNIHHIECIQYALTIVNVLVPSVPDIDYMMDTKFNLSNSYRIYNDNTRISIHMFFKHDLLSKEGKTPLSKKHSDIMHVVCKYMRMVRGWEVMYEVEGLLTYSILGNTEKKNLYMESFLNLCAYRDLK